MDFPPIIEIPTLTSAAPAEITVPGSKSITNRALILAALARGATVLTGALWSEDTEAMADCLKTLGFTLEIAPDPREPANRTFTVAGQAGRVPPGGTRENPLELFVGNAGTAARFLAALVCLGSGVYRLRGVPRMHERPQAALFQALRQLGYRIESPNDKLPALIYGGGPRPGHATVSIAESSQFASALLLCADAGGWQIAVAGENADESPYVAMTSQLRAQFPGDGGRFIVEPDASSGSYFWAAGWLLRRPGAIQPAITVAHWPTTGWQIDAEFPRFLPPPAEISRQRDLGDAIMTAIVLAPFANHPVRFTDLGRLRVQECERVMALRTELTRCGATVVEAGDTLTVQPSPLHGAEIETYDDHRMAMCFGTIALRVPGLRIKNPACVRKTFPNFFAKLATLRPLDK
jgi:3-phosphoshikimate 1-carboxyvinyltransferase